MVVGAFGATGGKYTVRPEVIMGAYDFAALRLVDKLLDIIPSHEGCNLDGDAVMEAYKSESYILGRENAGSMIPDNKGFALMGLVDVFKGENPRFVKDAAGNVITKAGAYARILTALTAIKDAGLLNQMGADKVNEMVRVNDIYRGMAHCGMAGVSTASLIPSGQ